VHGGRALHELAAGDLRHRAGTPRDAGGRPDPGAPRKRRPRAIQLFEVLRRSDAAEEQGWTRAETIDLTAPRSDHEVLDEIAAVLRASEPLADGDLSHVATLVRLTGRDTTAPPTTLEPLDGR
jgi:hypothetical protein